MFLSDDQLVGIAVETEQGERVGTLVGFVVDVDSGIIAQYRVRARGFFAMFFPTSNELLVHHTQVVSLDARRMVIRGRGTRVRADDEQRSRAPSAQPVATASDL
ncbi:MAG: PRC-barrel domain-containing protein [bacterium]|nr:PRC-barrel domain-containing protein [bacterium]